MIEFIKKDLSKNVILFVHGFIGSRATWIGSANNLLLPDYLLLNDHLKDNYDFALFNYYTKLSDKLETTKWLISLLKGGKKLKKNLSVEDLADLLYSEIQITLKDYQRIVIISHSMGGLVAKACIIKSLERKTNRNINLYLSLAVPHNGSNLANLGKAILNNPHVKDLAPLEDFINEVNTKWLKLENLPETKYYQGKYDQIVPKTSSIGYDRRQLETIFSDDDHFSIIKPENSNSVVVNSIIDIIIHVEKDFSIDSKEKTSEIPNSKGDNFSNISNSTIVNKSNITDLNKK